MESHISLYIYHMRGTKKYRALPYNSKLQKHARELRKAKMLHEVLFWQQVKNKQINGLDFDRQKIIGDYIVDFYCPEKNVAIELDGSSHRNKGEHDRKRDIFLSNLGLTVIRISATDILQNLHGVIEFIRNHDALK